MKRRTATVLLILTVLAGLLLTACGGQPARQQEEDTGKLRVVCTVFPQYDFVRAIAGDAVDLSMLLPPGSECHSFEPSPKDIIAMHQCDLLLYVGGESDAWVEEILASDEAAGVRGMALTGLVPTLDEEKKEGMQGAHGEEAEEDDGHGHAGEAHTDEHVWTAPKNAMLIVQALCETLCEEDPDGADAYRANAAAYLKELEKLDEELQTVVDGGDRRTLVFGDRFPFLYLAREYGLDYYAAFTGCSTETGVSAGTLAFLIDKVKEEDIPVVFHIEFSNGQIADAVCEATGAEKRMLHSCHNVSREELEAGETYLTLMHKNAETLKEALA